MKIFFDVDYTILSFDGLLRPHVHEVFAKLVEDGHEVYIWSGVGLRHEVVRQFELGAYVSGVYWKPIENYRDRMVELGVDVEPDFIIDDHHGIVEELGGIVIRPFNTFDSSPDMEMWRVYKAIQGHAANHHNDSRPVQGA